MPLRLPLDCRLYTDGGNVGPNPSALGGTWAAVFVEREVDRALAMASGIVRPWGYDAAIDSTSPRLTVAAISNNVSELLAAVEGMERLPDGWAGVLYTDSGVTRCRLVNKNPSFAGVPLELYQRVAAQRKRFPRLSVVLLDGHPNLDQLASGRGKRGNPVSWWNCRADQECTRLAGRAWRPPSKPRKKVTG
jgi:ribonuclease HI